MTIPNGLHNDTAGAKVKRVAIYARYSSDMQRESSIEDQIRKCRQYASKQGWVVLEDYVRYDQAISGALFDERIALQSLISEAEQNPQPFDLLLVEDTSRLARNVEDQLFTLKVLNFHGVNVISVSQGLDSGNPSARLSFTFQGLMDEQFLEKLSSSVRRGQEGCVLKGKYIAGGKCYGYRNVNDEHPTLKGDHGRPLVLGVMREIVPEEAAVVQRIFKMYDDGLSFEKIARILRAERIPAPRPPRKTSVRAWSIDGISEMLRNEIYIGQYIWKKTTSVRDPKTRRMIARPTPEGEWVRSDRPGWRIISDELWNRVQEQRAHKNRFGIRKLGGLERTKRSQKYLFSGLLFCGLCHRPINIVDGTAGGVIVRYGCGTHRYKGACSNATTIRRDRLEGQLLTWLTRDLVSSDSMDKAAQSFYSKVQKRISELQAQVRKEIIDAPDLRKELAEKKQEAWNMTDFIVANGCQSSPTVHTRLALAEIRIKEIEEQLSRARAPSIVAFSPDEIKQQLLSKVQDLQSVLTSLPLLARQILRKHIRKIILTPGQLDGKRVLEAAVEFELGSEGDLGVMLTETPDGSSQQYGFSSITVTGRALHTRALREKRALLPPMQSACAPS